MGLLDWFESRWKSESKKYKNVSINSGHVLLDGGETTSDEPFKAGDHYFRLWLVEMSLENDREWFTEWHPAVHASINFRFGNKETLITRIAGSSLLPDLSAENLSRVVGLNYAMTPLIPFTGGSIELSAGLLAVAGKNDVKGFLKVLGDFSNLLMVPQLSAALAIATPVASGLGDLVGATRNSLMLGFHQTWTAGSGGAKPLNAGYFTTILADEAELDDDKLWVANGRLRYGESLATAKPLRGYNYMLFRLERRDERDDWDSLAAIQEPYNQALEMLRVGNKDQADAYIRSAKAAAFQSAELTRNVDERRVVMQIQQRFDEAREHIGMRAFSEGEDTSFSNLMQGAIPINEAKALGRLLPEDVGLKGLSVPEVREADGQNRLRNGNVDSSKAVPVDEVGEGAAPARPKPRKTRSAPRGLSPLDRGTVKPSFYFATEGDGVRGDQVKLSAEFDLIFNYGVPSGSVLVKTQGKDLDSLLTAETAELDIALIPRGFILKDSKWIQRATFVNGSIDKPVVFHLQASDEIVADAGISVIMETKGAVLYEFFIPLQLVENLSATAGGAPFSPLEFNLDELAQAQSREQRAARLHIFADGDRLSINFDNLSTGESFSVRPTNPTRTSLAGLLGDIKVELNGIPDHSIWQKLEDSLAKPAEGSSTEKGFKFCLEGVAAAGALLYKELAQNEDVERILKAIDNLPYGSTLSIRTDCAFLPWEILNPSEFILKFKDAYTVQPQNFWGNRLAIECLLAGQKQNYKTPTGIHQTSPAYVSMNIFRTIDEDFAQMKVLPGQSHEALSAELAPVKTEVRKTGDEILKVFVTPNYDATFIYLFCHGQNDKALNPDQQETLEVDTGNFLKPTDLPTKIKYPRGPIVFLNSCSSGSYSPLAFSTFLSALREKQALGLVSTSFPVPITFGSAFGRELMRRYFKNQQPLGKVLLKLRQEQLANGNPIGLFYSLQCPADVTARKN